MQGLAIFSIFFLLIEQNWGKHGFEVRIDEIYDSTWVNKKNVVTKGNRTIADLKYGGEDIISPSTLIFAPIKSYLGKYTLHIPPEVL